VLLGGGGLLKVVVDHHADVYGICAHPQRPFVIATASRDTTIRLWSLDTMFTRLKIRALCGENVLAAKASDAAAGGVGSTSTELAQVLPNLEPNPTQPRVSVARAPENGRASPPQGPQEGGLAHLADTSRSNLAAALGRFSRRLARP
jgi:WD40 repeat protein